MQRSSSHANITNNIKFDPKQFRIGSSSIDKLPIRRSSSTKNLAQNSKNPSQKNSRKISQKRNSLNRQTEIEALQYNVEWLNRMNQSLQRQNLYLKKQLQFYSNTKQARPNITQQNEKQKKDKYKQKLLSRINKNNDQQNRVRSGKRLSTEDFTVQSTGYGLLNSKMSTPKKTPEQTIKQSYEIYENQGKLPTIDSLTQLVNGYLEAIKDNYYKLKIMLQKNKIKQNGPQKEEYKKVSQCISLLQLPIVYRRNPKIARKLFRELNDQPSQIKKKPIQQFTLELYSPQQILLFFESICKYSLKNQKICSKLASSLSLHRLFKKIRQ